MFKGRESWLRLLLWWNPEFGRYKIICLKVPVSFAGEGPAITFMLPWLTKGGLTCRTECPVLNPHHKGKKAKDYSLTFYGTEVLPRRSTTSLGSRGRTTP